MTQKELGILKKSPLFTGVEPGEIDRMLGCLAIEMRGYAKNETILHTGDVTSSVGMVVTGCVHIIDEDFWGNRNIISEGLPGDLFAESYACTRGAELDISVIAAEDCELLFIGVGRIMTTCPTACDHHSRLIRNLLSVIARKNIKMHEKLTHLTRRSTREKLLSYLSAESSRQGRASFEIPFNRQQLADYLSVDRSAMSSELCRMRDEGLVSFEKNRFVLK